MTKDPKFFSWFHVLVIFVLPAIYFAATLLPKKDHGAISYDKLDMSLPLINPNGTISGDLSLPDLAGTPVIMHFSASWCSVCRSEKESWLQFSKQQEASPENGQFRIIDVLTSDSVAALNETGYVRNIPNAMILDAEGRLATALGVIGVPQTIVIDRKGRIVTRFEGPLNETKFLALNQKIQELVDISGL